MEGILLFMAIVLVKTTPTFEQEEYMEKISNMVVFVLGQQEVSSCHLVLLTTQPRSYFVTAILRKLNGGVVAAITDPPDQHIFSEAIWGNSRTCRTLILHFDNTKNNTNLTLRLLERTGHWKQSETKVVVVGGKPDVKDIFLHHSFRNTVHGVYLAVNPNILITQNSRPRLRAQLPDKDQLFNFEGRQLKYISSRYFPYIDFPHDIDEIPVPISPYDTVDVRLADTFAMKHNFT
ncbi:hypothetical protein Pmani_002036 [Petrolisthes manimaculis]|uniref:Uncharacterized protein n=1 Tax=Petrolisthes manimaculis TaxID=1843537 RepID=A0AAE1QIS9_9EUCA|nr:hypothetical protein Pmani_002036 [Petrolisthes manimaculis]